MIERVSFHPDYRWSIAQNRGDDWEPLDLGRW